MKRLSRNDIETISEKFVKAYFELPEIKKSQVYRIEPELMLEKVLGLTIEYMHLSYDGSILGMTSFGELGVQVFENNDDEAFFFLDGKTVLVESDLNYDNNLKGRKNFTLMHEGSHQIFKMLFPNDYGITEKSAGVHYYKATADTEKSRIITDWEEWQANTLAAAILLPRCLIEKGMFLFGLGDKIECLNKIYYPAVYERYAALAVMVGTGLRVGELTGLRWCDIDLEEGIIDVNHTLVYYDHRTEGSKKGCYFNVNTTKTPAGMRQVPMLEFVKEALLMEKERQELLGLHCEATVDGYTDFIFVNRFGQPQHQATLNKAIRRIIRNCNDKQFLESENPEVLLPHFSCHSLRHTFTTRMCEAGVNVKVIQDALGHKDVSTTLNIYTDVTKELRKSEFEGLELQFNQ